MFSGHRWVKFVITGLITVIAPLVALAIWAQLLSDGSTSAPGGRIQPSAATGYSASWAVGYDSIPALTGASDLVVVGKVGDHRQFARDKLLFTDFTVEVVRAIKGAAPSSIVVMQTGGLDSEGRLHEMDDDPLFADKATYLLFLVKDPNSTKYYVAGGPGGRFVVDGNQIHSLSASYPQRKIFDTGLDSLALEAAVRQVGGQP